MSSLRELVFDRCTGHAGTAALIGTRCYPDRLPQNVTLPCVVYSAPVSDVDTEYRTHEPVMVPRSVARVQIDAYAETGDGAEALANALVAAWSGHQSLPDIGPCQVQNRIATWETGTERYRTIIDVLVDYRR